jgi:putative hydrolase of the HAD superfamily
LARDWVENHAKYLLFDDVPVVLPRLRRQGYTLGVLSNTYPSLEAAFQALGLRELFRVFLISSKLGVVKPAPRIFAYAIERLGVAPGEILLVDDVAENIEAATAAGLQGVQIARYDAHPSSGMWIRDLYELEKLLTAEQ